MGTGLRISAILISIFGLFGSISALAATTMPAAPSSLTDPTCLAILGGECVLRSPHRSMEFVFQGDGTLYLLMRAPSEPVSVPASEVVAGAEPISVGSNTPVDLEVAVLDDILTRVAQGVLTADEAAMIVEDLDMQGGSVYELPDLRALKLDLGFPENAEFAAEDMRELVRTHLQMSLGVRALTAAYLADLMGVAEPPAPPNDTDIEFLMNLVAE